MAMENLAHERVWCDKSSYDKAECSYFEHRSKGSRMPTCSDIPASGSLAKEVAKARQYIKQGLQCVTNMNHDPIVHYEDLSSRFAQLELDNQELRATVNRLSNDFAEIQKKFLKIIFENLGQTTSGSYPTAPTIATCPAKPSTNLTTTPGDDDDIDLFESDSEGEDVEAAKIREERLAAYAAKKSKKPVLIAKSNIIFDVKPWDDETDMENMEKEVRKIVSDGLLWGASKLVPLAYGIRKLQISCVLEDDKVSVDWLTEQIEANEDLVQSVDIAAFNKV